MSLFKKNIFKSISTGYLVFIATNIIALILTPYILKYVSKEEFGLYVLCIDLFTWIGFLQFGTAKVLGPLIAIENAKKNKKRIITLFNTSFLFQLLMAIIIIPLFYYVAEYSTSNSVISNVNEKILFLLFATASAIEVLKQQLSEMLIAAKQMYIDNLLNLTFTILRFILILLLIPHFGIITVFAIYLLIAILNFIRAFYRVKKIYPFLKIKFIFFDFNEIKNLLTDGIYFSLGSLATILILKFDNFFLSKELGLEFVSKLYISIRLILIGQKIIEILFNNFRPYIAGFHGNEDADKIKKFFHLGSKLNFIMTILGVSFILLINKHFVSWWVGDSYYLGDDIVILYAMFYLTYIISQPVRIIMVSTLTKIKNASISRFIEGIIRIIIIYSLFTYTGLKILPISSFVLTAIFQFLYITFLVSKANKWNTKKEILRGITFLFLPIIINLSIFVLNTNSVLWLFAISSLLISTLLIYSEKTTIIAFVNNIKKKQGE